MLNSRYNQQPEAYKETMRSLLVLIELFIILAICMKVVHSSTSSYPNRRPISVQLGRISHVVSQSVTGASPQPKTFSPASYSLDGQTDTVSVAQLAIEMQPNNGAGNLTAANSTSTTPSSTTTTTQATHDPDLDEPALLPPLQDNNSTNKAPNKDDPGGGGDKNSNKANNSTSDNQPGSQERANIELSVLWYSVFMVYVSFVKLIYHNIAMVKRNLTEPGILMIFGIIWELISRQLNSSSDVSPRFNSRIFFYLFLPATVLESASILSNKWLLLNLLPILIHSIVGTLLYGSAIAFTIYSMSKQDLFNIGTSSISGRPTATTQIAAMALFEGGLNQNHWLTMNDSNNHQTRTTLFQSEFTQMMNDEPEESTFLYEKSYVIDEPMLEVGNLTLADCLIFGSIMSSLDSTTMLGAFSMFQVNEKLYYLVLGESLMNNAVVLIVFNLLLDFLNASRLTVFKIYIAIIQFFITLIGSVFVGLLLAGVALLAVRLIKRFQVPSALTSYQNQCLAMIETLLVLKLAYLTYTLGSLAGLSSIISLATFGVLQDQYIRLNLNLRTQLTFRQVVLASKTLGFSLVYPLLGMLLVDVSYASQHVHYANRSLSSSISRAQGAQQVPAGFLSGAATLAATKLTSFASQASLLWNFKFLSLVTTISVAYRFGIVILLSLFCNLISNRKVKVRLREQFLMAYGGLKGPLAVALVHRLIEHEDHRDRLLRNKHLFMYTILFITLLSVIFKGAFIRTLVERMQISLHHSELAANQKVVLFNAINTKVIECATQAMNNLMGRSRSPYDRLFDFNEHRIKPWLARDGSNTNWLSLLYDKLLLDETLDSDCFHKPTQEPIAGPFWHSKVQPAELLRNHRGSRTSAKLDTINEHGGEFIDDEMGSHFGLSFNQASANRQRQVKNVPRKVRNSLAGPGATSSTHKDAGLKELVMQDLDNGLARKRPSKSVQRADPDNGTTFDRLARMLSSSSNEEAKVVEQSSSDKEDYISQLERHLESRKKSQAAPSVGGPSAPHRAVGTKSSTNAKGESKLHHGSRERSRKHVRHLAGGSNKHYRGKFSRIDPSVATSSSD